MAASQLSRVACRHRRSLLRPGLDRAGGRRRSAAPGCSGQASARCRRSRGLRRGSRARTPRRLVHLPARGPGRPRCRPALGCGRRKAVCTMVCPPSEAVMVNSASPWPMSGNRSARSAVPSWRPVCSPGGGERCLDRRGCGFNAIFPVGEQVNVQCRARRQACASRALPPPRANPCSAAAASGRLCARVSSRCTR